MKKTISALLLTASASAGADCLPSCDVPVMFSLSGPGIATIVDEQFTVFLAVPGDATEWTIGVFDGDISGPGGHWDLNGGAQNFTVHPNPDGSDDLNPLELATVLDTIDSATLADNAWTDTTFAVSPLAYHAGDDRYYYAVVASPITVSNAENNFQVRATSTTDDPKLSVNYWPIIAAARTRQDYETIYPTLDYDAAVAAGSIPPAQLADTIYDGSLSVCWQVANKTPWLKLWDGDFDFGSHASLLPATADTDDPDTAPGDAPPFAIFNFSALPEGAQGVGAPPDDNQYELFRRDGSVTYTLIGPTISVENENPSGNREWERFFVEQSRMPAGEYCVLIEKLDLSNKILLSNLAYKKKCPK